MGRLHQAAGDLHDSGAEFLQELRRLDLEAQAALRSRLEIDRFAAALTDITIFLRQIRAGLGHDEL